MTAHQRAHDEAIRVLLADRNYHAALKAVTFEHLNRMFEQHRKEIYADRDLATSDNEPV